MTLQECVDSVAEGLQQAEEKLLEIRTDHMENCTAQQIANMRKLHRKLRRIHFDLADARDDCFPDVTVQSGGT